MTGFDLSPVIGLLRVLPPTSPSPTSPSYTYTTSPACSADDKEKLRSLGDFNELWRFLATPDSGGAKLSPDLEIAEPTKPRKAVAFAEIVSTSFPSVTKLKRKDKSTFPTSGSDTDTPPARPVITTTTPPSNRKRNIIQTLISQFPDCSSTLLHPPQSTDLDPAGIHVFIDNSNILIGFYNTLKSRRGIPKTTNIRRPTFSFHSLTLILERGRPVARKILVGSSPITPSILEAKELGYETSILERVRKERPSTSSSGPSSGSESAGSKVRKIEQGVDEIVSFKLLESLVDYEPGTLVLASGDGAVGEYSPGFFRVVERYLARGWKVELVAFKKALSGAYRDGEFRRRWRGRFRVVELDGFVEDLLG